MDKIEMQRAMAVAPETANGTSPAVAQEPAELSSPETVSRGAPAPASRSRKQRSGKAAPDRASHSPIAGRGSAKYHHAPEGPDAQPASASVKRRSSQKLKEQQ